MTDELTGKVALVTGASRGIGQATAVALARAGADELMKLILTSDLHQRIEKWGDLVSAVQTQKPRFVLIAGDLLPKVEAVSQQGEFFSESVSSVGSGRLVLELSPGAATGCPGLVRYHPDFERFDQ